MIEIKNRLTGDVIHRDETAETLRDAVINFIAQKRSKNQIADLRGSDLSYSDLRYSDLRGSDLSYSDLRYSDLRGSDLRGSDLRGSDLRGSDLRYSDLRGSDLRGSDLSYSDAVARGAIIEGSTDDATNYVSIRDDARVVFPEVPIVPNLDKQICDLVHAEKLQFDMDTWHGDDSCDESNWCETTHCRAGSSVCLAGKEGFELERKVGPEQAGRLIYLVSTGRQPDFFASNEDALKDICEWGAKDSEVQK